MATKISEFPAITDLVHLERIASAFRQLALLTPGGMSKSQRSGWKWLEEAFYTPSIMDECRRLDPPGKLRVDNLLTSVENILSPDDDDDDDPQCQQPGLFACA